MDFEFNDKELIIAADKMSVDSLYAIGAFVDTKIIENIRKNFNNSTSQLANSTSFKVDEKDKSVRNSVNAVYAAIQELGGDIKPVDAQALAVPIHPDAKGKSPREFDNLIYIKRNGAAPLLVRKAGRGKNGTRTDLMYVLVKKVRIPASPYIRPAIYENLDQILRLAKVA